MSNIVLKKRPGQRGDAQHPHTHTHATAARYGRSTLTLQSHSQLRYNILVFKIYIFL